MLTERFEQALLFAARAHQKQRRRGGEIPYLAHLMSVAALVLEHGGGEQEAIAALLHDAIEDQGGPAMREEILRQFGPQIATIVQACSDTDQTPKPPWLGRKQAYIGNVKAAPPEVRLVSLADKVHNVRSILSDYRAHGEQVFARFKGGVAGTIWYYRSLVDAFAAAQPPVAEPLVRELDRCVTELERLTGVSGHDLDPGALPS